MDGTTQDDRIMSIITPLGKDYFLIDKLSATEALSSLFEFNVELLYRPEDKNPYSLNIVDPKKLIGKAVSIEVRLDDGTNRYFNGIASRFTQGGRDRDYSYYRLTIVPQLWVLTKRFQSRIFQQISVPDILKKVLAGLDVKYELQGTFEPRNYCVQYQETDFAFISRLMEEEGIYYYFKHTKEGKHTMTIANTPQSHEDCPSKSKIPFELQADGEAFVSSIATWLADYQMQTGKVTLWDTHLELPGKNLSAEKQARQNIGADSKLEHYEFPGNYALKFDGIDKSGGEQASELNKVFTDNKRIAEIRMQEIDAQYEIFSGISDCCTLTAGHRFSLEEHPNKEYSKNPYTIISVTHEVEQSPDYRSNDTVSNPYRNSFTCMSNTYPFRPPKDTPKPMLYGSQTAFVVGTPGEEIFTDKYGRVKVQFQWDREGESNGESSCWIRVSQPWAGNGWGAMTIPRIGMEVVVKFLEGNPDQPLITGCVYNAGAMPPYKLPDEKTKTTFKTNSSPDGGGFNELRFEDKKGDEDIFIHAEKDLDVRVKNDRRGLTLRDDHLIVDRDKCERVRRDLHRTVERDVMEDLKRDHQVKIAGKYVKEITKSVSLKVGENRAEKVGQDYAIKVDGNYTVEAKQIVLKADMGLTINVGGNFVTINSAGVSIKGTLVLINSGGAALPAVPGTLIPVGQIREAEIALNADPGSKLPTYKNQRQQMSPIQAQSINAPSHNSNSPRNENKKSWIEIKLVDEDNKPVPGEKYRVTLTDGSTLAEGTLDEKGEARVECIDPGSCKITFPNLHKDSWDKK